MVHPCRPMKTVAGRMMLNTCGEETRRGAGDPPRTTDHGPRPTHHPMGCAQRRRGEGEKRSTDTMRGPMTTRYAFCTPHSALRTPHSALAPRPAPYGRRAACLEEDELEHNVRLTRGERVVALHLVREQRHDAHDAEVAQDEERDAHAKHRDDDGRRERRRPLVVHVDRGLGEKYHARGDEDGRDDNLERGSEAKVGTSTAPKPKAQAPPLSPPQPKAQAPPKAQAQSPSRKPKPSPRPAPQPEPHPDAKPRPASAHPCPSAPAPSPGPLSLSLACNTMMRVDRTVRAACSARLDERFSQMMSSGSGAMWHLSGPLPLK
eukprot:5036127-Prymnesium_polylepis.1